MTCWPITGRTPPGSTQPISGPWYRSWGWPSMQATTATPSFGTRGLISAESNRAAYARLLASRSSITDIGGSAVPEDGDDPHRPASTHPPPPQGRSGGRPVTGEPDGVRRRGPRPTAAALPHLGGRRAVREPV